MPADPSAVATEIIRSNAHMLPGAATDYDPLLERIGDEAVVCIGEASHGTHEFYLERAKITQRLIREKGFNMIAVEADWPDALRVHQYASGQSVERDADAALGNFRRFPAWMWRNTVVRDFIQWLRTENESRPDVEKVGFYGMDLYSLHASIEGVLSYLDEVDPAAAKRARQRYSCFDQFGGSPQLYARVVLSGAGEPCENQAVEQLIELRRQAGEFLSRNGNMGKDRYFFAVQNARVIRNAEKYYRSMYRRRDVSWNLRDTHMVDTLDALITHAHEQAITPKIVVWAHNSHLGDARATEMSEQGELNVGQLVRERYGKGALLIGFSTYSGTVTAANDWDEPAERRNVRPALPGSYEELLHGLGVRFMLDLREADVAKLVKTRRIQRAIGVIYRPQTERMSHYFQTDLSSQFDWIIHLDQTRALEPLERNSAWDKGEFPETYPFNV